MSKNIHAFVIAAAASAGLLALSASPSLACVNVTADPSCTMKGPESVHGPVSMTPGTTNGAGLYSYAPGGLAGSPQSPARHAASRHIHQAAKSQQIHAAAQPQ